MPHIHHNVTTDRAPKFSRPSLLKNATTHHSFSTHPNANPTKPNIFFSHHPVSPSPNLPPPSHVPNDAKARQKSAYYQTNPIQDFR
jgi:hypothetical protein